MEWYSFKIYEHDHFYKSYEDYKNNLYILHLNTDIEEWLDENIKNHHDINCDDYYNSGGSYKQKDVDYIIIEFTDKEDAMAFKLRWL